MLGITLPFCFLPVVVSIKSPGVRGIGRISSRALSSKARDRTRSPKAEGVGPNRQSELSSVPDIDPYSIRAELVLSPEQLFSYSPCYTRSVLCRLSLAHPDRHPGLSLFISLFFSLPPPPPAPLTPLSVFLSTLLRDRDFSQNLAKERTNTMLSLPSRVSEESERAWKVGPRWFEGSRKNEARVAVRREKEMGEKTRERCRSLCTTSGRSCGA